MEMPPESKQRPLPTSTTGAAPFGPAAVLEGDELRLLRRPLRDAEEASPSSRAPSRARPSTVTVSSCRSPISRAVSRQVVGGAEVARHHRRARGRARAPRRPRGRRASPRSPPLVADEDDGLASGARRSASGGGGLGVSANSQRAGREADGQRLDAALVERAGVERPARPRRAGAAQTAGERAARRSAPVAVGRPCRCRRAARAAGRRRRPRGAASRRGRRGSRAARACARARRRARGRAPRARAPTAAPAGSATTSSGVSSAPSSAGPA